LKAKEKTSIGIAVSFETSSNVGYKIVMLRTDSFTATVTTLAVITRAGMNYIPAQDLKKMCETNGLKATVANRVIGDDDE
jgi:chorismate mutase